MDTKRAVFGAVMALVFAGGALAQGGMGMMGDGDAKVTKEQFLQRAEERFARMDANKDGVIDASDRQKMRERMRDGAGEGEGKKKGPPSGDRKPGENKPNAPKKPADDSDPFAF